MAAHYYALALLIIFNSALSQDASTSEQDPQVRLHADTLARLGGSDKTPPRSVMPIQTQIGLLFSAIEEIDVKTRRIGLLAREVIVWRDPRAAFDPAQYEGEWKAYFHPEEIWTPGVVFYTNAVPAHSRTRWQDFEVKLTKSGKFTALVPVRVDVICKDLRQEVDCVSGKKTFHCSFIAGPWHYDTREVEVDTLSFSDKNNLNVTLANDQWAALDLTSEAALRSYPCCPNVEYGTVDFTFTFAEL